ncbi:MAG: hypothetical protein JXM68_05585 [Sedimentisphaerales bacterium]|nr:hypothetical protein [Sedimentisphaerales bacterium]
MSELNYRKLIVDMLIEPFRADERLYLLVGDMGFGAIDRLKSEFPDRVINCGIMEQASVGIAAGMAMAGLRPIFYSIVNFLAFRALEQVRNDVLLQGLNVKFIATGAENYFRFLGPSHCCGKDDIKIMELIGMKVYDPYQYEGDFQTLVNNWINADQSGYIRV